MTHTMTASFAPMVWEIFGATQETTLRQIVLDVARAKGVHRNHIMGRRRLKHYAIARQEVMRRAYETGLFSYEEIGVFLGRDHTTVMHGIKAAQSRLAR